PVPRRRIDTSAASWRNRVMRAPIGSTMNSDPQRRCGDSVPCVVPWAVMKRILAVAVCAVASVVLSACGSSRPTPVPVVKHYRGAASLTFVASGPSTELGVENTDLYVDAPGGLRDVTSTAA